MTACKGGYNRSEERRSRRAQNCYLGNHIYVFRFILSLVCLYVGDRIPSTERSGPLQLVFIVSVGCMKDGSALRAPSDFAEAVRPWRKGPGVEGTRGRA